MVVGRIKAAIKPHVREENRILLRMMEVEVADATEFLSEVADMQVYFGKFCCFSRR